jgi:hypothetical protein
MTLAVGDKCTVPAVAIRWDDGVAPPGDLEVVLTDRHGVTHQWLDRYVYFAGPHEVGPQATYPIDVGVVCIVIALDGDSATVQSLDCVAEDGEDRVFDVTVDMVRRYAKDGETCELPATAVRWLAVEPQPGLVLVELLDDWYRPSQLIGEAADFGNGTDLTPDGTYPRPTQVHCTIDRLSYDTATITILGPTDSKGRPFVTEVALSELNPVDS